MLIEPSLVASIREQIFMALDSLKVPVDHPDVTQSFLHTQQALFLVPLPITGPVVTGFRITIPPTSDEEGWRQSRGPMPVQIEAMLDGETVQKDFVDQVNVLLQDSGAGRVVGLYTGLEGALIDAVLAGPFVEGVWTGAVDVRAAGDQTGDHGLRVTSRAGGIGGASAPFTWVVDTPPPPPLPPMPPEPPPLPDQATAWFTIEVPFLWDGRDGAMPLRVVATREDGTPQPHFNGTVTLAMDPYYGQILTLRGPGGEIITGREIALYSGVWQGSIMIRQAASVEAVVLTVTTLPGGSSIPFQYVPAPPVVTPPVVIPPPTPPETPPPAGVEYFNIATPFQWNAAQGPMWITIGAMAEHATPFGGYTGTVELNVAGGSQFGRIVALYDANMRRLPDFRTNAFAGGGWSGYIVLDTDGVTRSLGLQCEDPVTFRGGNSLPFTWIGVAVAPAPPPFSWFKIQPTSNGTYTAPNGVETPQWDSRGSTLPMPVQIGAMIDDGTPYNGFTGVVGLSAVNGNVVAVYNAAGSLLPGVTTDAFVGGSWQGFVAFDTDDATVVIGIHCVEPVTQIGGNSTPIAWKP